MLDSFEKIQAPLDHLANPWFINRLSVECMDNCHMIFKFLEQRVECRRRAEATCVPYLEREEQEAHCRDQGIDR
ncbi:hypothetical protein GRAN_5239 [Granulicella sibirica]|uniref:Uncharacterized protein n=1 Tax=Granulicella sibirica TaxID=2479048 RepID=A0A4Q0SXK1_9BACT|nr:hypothetical protein GRAN_5239 [Granulicella sibirica]